jgi:predicted PurR-regulated permease PerM
MEQGKEPAPPPVETAMLPGRAGSPGRIKQFAQLSLVLLLVIGCWRVLQPFFPAIMFSIVIAVSTWPAHQWILNRLHGRAVSASLLSCLLVAVVVIVPAAVLAMSLRDGALWMLKLIDEWRSAGATQPPQWLARVPWLGEQIQNWWRDNAGSESGITGLFTQFADPARRLALASARALGNGLAQTALAALLLYFLYRDGGMLGRRLDAAARRIGGDYARDLLSTAQRTVVGVMFSVIGTALAQAMVAIAGFAIAGVPNPFLLGSLTFVLAMAPVGPPLIWGGATLWLTRHGEPGWAIFMAVYGFFGISAIDNVIKPLLISRSSHLPFALTFMGVIGGVLAFGVAGVFVGPTLLALAINLGGQAFSKFRGEES